MHLMEHLGEFHKSTRRGYFVKIFEIVHEMEHFRKFLLVCKWENTIHKNHTHIFSKHQCSKSIESTSPPPKKLFRRFAPEMCTIWRKSHYQRISQNMHILEHLGEFHKSTRRGDFAKISKMCTKWSIFENIYIFSNEKRGFIKITHIFSQKIVQWIHRISSPPKKISGASRRKCAQSRENPITRESPKICMFWSIWGVY